MTVTTVKYKDWVLEVESELTQQTYNGVSVSGAESCECNDSSRVYDIHSLGN